MIKKDHQNKNNPLLDDLLVELSQLQEFSLPASHIHQNEKNMLRIFQQKHQNNKKTLPALLDRFFTPLEPTFIIALFLFLSWDVFCIILYLLKL